MSRDVVNTTRFLIEDSTSRLLRFHVNGAFVYRLFNLLVDIDGYQKSMIIVEITVNLTHRLCIFVINCTLNYIMYWPCERHCAMTAVQIYVYFDE